MRIGLNLGVAPSMAALGDEVVAHEQAGVRSVTLGEAYTFDAVSQLGYLAARTSTVELATGILPIFTRTPTVLAMTAAGLDYASDGRFRLGLGASGPQVVEGFHGVLYDAPIGRTREIVEICRTVWRREKLEHAGKHYAVPLPAGQGSGEGRPLKLINHPVRDRIPVSIAALGPKTVAVTAELADGWEPIFFYAPAADAVWGEALAAGRAKRDPSLDPLDVIVRAPLAVTDDVEPYEAQVRDQLALYIGGMGSKRTNFYNRLVTAYGFADEAATIQELFLSGHAAEAAAAVPQALVDGTSLVGSADEIGRRLRAFADAGVTLLNVTPLRTGADARVADVALVAQLAGTAAAGADR